MLVILALILLGLLLISAELFVPGGILGTLGGIAILVACYYAYVEFGAVGAGGVFVGSAILVTVTVYVEFKLLRKTKFGQRIFLDAASGGKSLQERADSEIPADLVGKEGETITTLAPSGKVIVEGMPYDAYSQSGLMRRGQKIQVVGRDALRLVVKSL